MDEILYRLECLKAAQEVCRGYDDSGRECEASPERVLQVATLYAAFVVNNIIDDGQLITALQEGAAHFMECSLIKQKGNG